MSTEPKIDYSKLSEFELLMIVANRDIAHFAKERWDEIINKYGEAQGLLDSTAPTQQGKPQQSPAGMDFSNLPWKSYKTKQAAKPEEAAWIFSNAQGAEVLLATLKSTPDGKSLLGNYEYQIQGREGQFLARKPVK